MFILEAENIILNVLEAFKTRSFGCFGVLVESQGMVHWKKHSLCRHHRTHPQSKGL